MIKIIFLLLCVLKLSYSDRIWIQPGYQWCPYCLNFSSKNLNLLLQNIQSYEIVLKSCVAVCYPLKNFYQNQICYQICTIQGRSEFIEAIKQAQQDEIYFCQQIDMCPFGTEGALSIFDIQIEPESGPPGTTFQVNFTFNVTQETYTGMIEAVLFSLQQESNIVYYVYDLGYSVGIFSSRFQFKTDLTHEIGKYQGNIQFCNGKCGSDKPYSKTLANGRFSLDIS